MSRPFGSSVFLRGAAAALAGVLLSASALAASRSAKMAPCCRPAEAPMSCCADGNISADSSANCCRVSAPEEAAPSLQPSAPVLAAPPAIPLDRPLPPPTASLAGPSLQVPPRARSAPLFLLFAVFLI